MYICLNTDFLTVSWSGKNRHRHHRSPVSSIISTGHQSLWKVFRSARLARLSWPLISSSSNAGRRAVSPAISKAWFTVGSCDKWIIDRPHSFQNVPSVILALFSCDNNVWLSLLSLHWKPSLNFSDYFESLLVPQLLRGENDSKQSDEFRATGSRHLLKTVNDHVTVIFTSRARLHRSSPQDH